MPSPARRALVATTNAQEQTSMAPKGKATAPAPARLSLQKVALWVLTALLCLSVASKAQGLSPLYGIGKLYARGLMPLAAVYEIGTVALLYADRPIGVVALFAYIGCMPSAGSCPKHRHLLPLAPKAPAVAVLRRSRRSPRPPFGALCAGLSRPRRHSAELLHSGGTAYALASADASPEASGTGSGTAMHLQLVLTVLGTLLNVTNKGGFISQVLLLRTLTPVGFLKVGSGAAVLGALFSFAVSRHGIPAL